MTPLWNVDDIVKVLGGPSAVGRLTGNPASAVCGWKKKKRAGVAAPPHIPPKYYWIIKLALEEKGYFAGLDLFGFVGNFSKSA